MITPTPLRYIHVLTVSVALAAATTVPTREDRANILVIVADDLVYGDLGSYGATGLSTPRLDRLASEGMRFTNAHAPAGVCIPSSSGLMTGMYPSRDDRHPNQGPAIEEVRMPPASLRRNRGYANGMVGKWHLGFEGGIDFDHTRPLRGGPVDRGLRLVLRDPRVHRHSALFLHPQCFRGVRHGHNETRPLFTM